MKKILVTLAGVFFCGLVQGNDSPLSKTVVSIQSTVFKNWCTATIVGPRALLANQDCDGSDVTFTFQGKSYTAQFAEAQPSEVASDRRELQLLYTSKDIAGAEPMRIGGSAAAGTKLQAVGCQRGGAGFVPPEPQGTWSAFEHTVTTFYGVEMRSTASTKPYGSDGGDPVFQIHKGEKLLVGLTTREVDGDFISTRLDLSQARLVVNQLASDARVAVCGINSDCGRDPTPVFPPGGPACVLSVDPHYVSSGQTLILTLKSEGEITTAQIQKQNVAYPFGELKITAPEGPKRVWTYAKVVGPGGVCQAFEDYSVRN